MTYSVDFRRKVLSVHEKEGLTIAQVAARFDIGVASLVRWLKQPEPKVHGFRRRRIDRDALARDIEQYPDAYQSERIDESGFAHDMPRTHVYAPVGKMKTQATIQTRV